MKVFVFKLRNDSYVASMQYKLFFFYLYSWTLCNVQVPANLDETAIGSFPALSDDSIGSGILYGAVASTGDDRSIGLLGLLFYDTITGISSIVPDLSITAARNALNSKTENYGSQVCENQNGRDKLTCPMSFTMNNQEERTFTNAWQTTATNSYQYAKKFNFKQAVKVGLKAGASVVFKSLESSLDVTVETGQEWSMTNTWTESKQTSETTATKTAIAKSVTCGPFPVTVPAGHTVTVFGSQKIGSLSIPYKGNMSYLLKSGAYFTFPTAGEFSAVQSINCLFSFKYVSHYNDWLRTSYLSTIYLDNDCFTIADIHPLSLHP